MARLLELSLDSLNQQDTLGFVGKVKDILLGGYAMNVPVTVKNFLDTVDNYMAIQQVNSVKASKAKISDWDHYADDEWRSLDFQIKSGLCQHHNENQRAAAEIVNKVFSQYKDPTEMRYNKEYEILNKLLADLEKIPLDVQRAARVEENIIGLRRRVDDFRTIYTNEINLEDEEEIGLAKEVRVSLNQAWKRLSSRIEVDLAEQENNAALEDAVQKLNAAIRAVKPA